MNAKEIAKLAELGFISKEEMDQLLNPKSAEGFASNVVSSGKQYGSDIWSAVTDPIGTGKAVGQLALGAVQKVIPDEWDGGPDGEWNYENVANAVGGYYGDRYGGLSEIGETAYSDPVGLLSDLAFFAGAPLKAASTAAKVSKLTNPASSALQTAGKAVDMLDPLNSGMGLVGRGVSKVAGGANRAKKITGQNVKFSTSPSSPEADPAVRARMTETMLEMGLDPTDPKSIHQLHKAIDQHEIDAQAAISKFDEGGNRIDAWPAVEAISDVKKTQYTMADPDQAKAVKAIGDYESGAIDALANATNGTGMMTAEQMLKTRRAVDSKINYKNKGAKKTATKQAMQAYANKLREMLADNISGLKGVNKDYGRSLEIQAPLARAAAREGNNTHRLVDSVLAVGGVGAGLAMESLFPIVGSLLASKALKPASQQRLAQFFYDHSTGKRSISDRQLYTELLRAIAEVEQNTGEIYE